MEFSLLIEDRFYSGQTFECARLTRKVSLSTQRVGAPGTLKFDLLKAGDLSFAEGDPVRFSVDGVLLFYGYVFTKEQNRWGEIAVTCYDQLRYLKANQSFNLSGMTAGEIIGKISSYFELKTGVLEETGYRIPSFIQEDKECLDIVSLAVQRSIVETGKVFVFFDDCGALALREAEGMKCETALGLKSLVTDYTYVSDIDKDTYNRIKLSRPNGDTGRADVYQVQNSGNMERWGLLQYYEKVDENLNPAQIQAKAEAMLTYYDRARKTLSLSALGIPGLRAGQMVYVDLGAVGDMNLSRWMLVEQVEHTFENETHTMELETREIS